MKNTLHDADLTGPSGSAPTAKPQGARGAKNPAPSGPAAGGPAAGGPAAGGPATAEQVAAAWCDTKLAQVLYHDWESATYDQKWSISFDQRCVDYARDRFAAVAGLPEKPYGRSLEIGAGTGFFTLNLMLAGVIEEGAVTDISPGMVEVAKANAEHLGLTIDGQAADAETLPFEDASFDVVIGHAVIHHLPQVEQAFKEMFRVLKPGGRVVICGEPTRYGDFIARRLSRATWWAATNLTRLPYLRDSWARPKTELDESSRAAALEAVVDLHTFDPAKLRELVTRAGGSQVRTVTEELTAAWWGWPVRTMEAAVREERLTPAWRLFAFRSWRYLGRLDRLVKPVVPDALYYNVSVTATA